MMDKWVELPEPNNSKKKIELKRMLLITVRNNLPNSHKRASQHLNQHKRSRNRPRHKMMPIGT